MLKNIDIIRYLKLKLLTLKLILKNKNLRKLILIDLIFYIYSFFGFIGAVHLVVYYNFNLGEVSLSWALLFLPILFLKLSKELNKNKFEDTFENSFKDNK